jgi:hypothetical protein
MFTLEMLELLKEYRESTEQYDKERIKTSISNLIKEHPNEYEQFKMTQAMQLSSEQQDFLQSCESYTAKSEEETTPEQQTQTENSQPNELEQIRNYFERWNNEFLKNNDVNEVCEQIINEIIAKYLYKNFSVIEGLIKTDNGPQYEKFKNHLKNNVRAELAKKIENYYHSDAYKNLGFFSRMGKKHKILDFLKDIGNYKFDMEAFSKIF